MRELPPANLLERTALIIIVSNKLKTRKIKALLFPMFPSSVIISALFFLKRGRTYCTRAEAIKSKPTVGY